MQDPEKYQLPKGLHKNTLKVLEQCVCKIDHYDNSITVTYEESDEYYKSRIEEEKQFKYNGYQEKLSATERYCFGKDELIMMGVHLKYDQTQMNFADIISLPKQQQSDFTSLEELLALYGIDDSSTKEDEVDLQGDNSSDDLSL